MDTMRHETRPGQRREAGSALILAMLILLVLTVIGISGANQAMLQERMASNSKQQTDALFAADSGVAAALRELHEAGAGIDCNAAEGLIDGLAGTVGEHGEYNLSLLTPCDDTHSDFEAWLNVRSEGRVSGQAGSVRRVDFELFVPAPVYTDDNHPAFDRGIFADGKFVQNGKSYYLTGVHSNTAIDFANPSTVEGLVSVAGDGAVHGAGLEEGDFLRTDVLDVPRVEDFIAEFVEGGMVPPDDEPNSEVRFGEEHCDALSSGVDREDNPTGHITYYCEGNVEVGGSFSDVTIIATGDLTHNGAAQYSAEGESNTAFIAQGNMEFNGKTGPSTATYWTDGDFVHNGSSDISGSVVASGEVVFNGGSSFVAEDVSNPWLPPAEDDDEDNLAFAGYWRQTTD
ncbi:pilus assembly PilX family protein [Alkalilimnicola ehrlichii MLHE-1]|nr:PilX N-terminal domain-containing pilus assembly protein [Alkalilimnicola ehrlichii]